MATECKYYEAIDHQGMKILVKKEEPETVILTRRRLLQVCSECPDQDDCKSVNDLHRILKFTR